MILRYPAIARSGRATTLRFSSMLPTNSLLTAAAAGRTGAVGRYYAALADAASHSERAFAHGEVLVAAREAARRAALLASSRAALRDSHRVWRILKRAAMLALLAAPLLVLLPLEYLFGGGKDTSTAQASGPVLWLPEDEEEEGGGDGSRSGSSSSSSSSSNTQEVEEEEADTRWAARLLARYLSWSVARAGPTIVKLAQWASSRDDLLSPGLCASLSRLQSHNPPHAWRHTARALRQCFGEDWAQVLHIDNREPIGSGCVAQVYRGRVVKKGRATEEEEGEEGEVVDVAVKVLHPHVKEMVRGDLDILRVGAAALEWMLPSLKVLSPSAVVEDFAFRMEQQLDLTIEGEHLEKFRRNFRDVPTIQFPEPVKVVAPMPQTSEAFAGNEQVLVESFVKGGQPILSFISDPTVATEAVKRRLADICLRSVVKMVLLDNFLHGDLHPGNIFVVCGDDDPQVGSGRPGGKAMNLDDLRVVLLDAGLAVGLDDQQHRQLVSILEAFTKNDGRKAAQLAVEASKKKEGKDDGQGASVYGEAQDLEAFLDGCDAVVREAKMSQNLTRTLSKHISDMFALAAKHNVRLESFFVSTAIPVRVMEGIGARLSPDVEIASVAEKMMMFKGTRGWAAK